MAEGGGLLNRYTGFPRIEGSNPSLSANFKIDVIMMVARVRLLRTLSL